MTRSEHIEWAKRRAREYLDAGQPREAVASMTSDLNKHDDTRGLLQGAIALLAIHAASSTDEARRFVEGF